MFGLLLSLLLLGAGPALAQNEEAPANEAAAAEARDPFGRDTPADAVENFVSALSRGDYEQAANFLDLSDLSPRRRAERGPQLAEQLQLALDRAGRFERSSQLSDDPAGRFGDGLAPDLERVGELGSGEGQVPILLRQVEGEAGPHWVIAGETIDESAAFARSRASTPAERWLPERMSETMVAGAPASHWLSALALPFLIFLLVWSAGWLLIGLIKRLRNSTSNRSRLALAWVAPIALLAATITTRAVLPLIGVSIVVRQNVDWVLEAFGWFAVAWLAWRLVDSAADHSLARLGRKGRASARSVVDLGGRIVKIAIILVAFTAVLNVFGVNVTAALAALGIGGIALALGAQKTVENLIASLTIISDRPFRVGDACRFGTTVAIVEEIGMRSTRVRTLDRTLLTIPNSQLAQAEIENFTRRDGCWFHPMLHFPLDTPAGKLRPLLSELTEMLSADLRLKNEGLRVRLLPPAQDRLPVEVFAHSATADFDEFLKVQEDLLLALLERIEGHGLKLAAPPLELLRPERPSARNEGDA